MQANTFGLVPAKRGASYCTPTPHQINRGIKRKLPVSDSKGSGCLRGAMVADPFFLQDEERSPLLSRLLSPQGVSKNQIIGNCAARAQHLLMLLPDVGDISVEPGKYNSKDCLNIFICDAERTFCLKDNLVANRRTRERQASMCEALRLVHSEVQDYHQGLGYIVAFLHVFLGMQDVVRVALTLHRSRRHSVGYFRKESQSFVRDARVFHRLVKDKDCVMAEHLERLGCVPELYAVKWFVGLCVHVLPWLELLDFWEGYFKYGTSFLFHFGLAYMSEFRTELLGCSSTSAVLTVLRMEDPACDWRFPKKLEAGIDLRFQRVIKAALRDAALPDNFLVPQMRLEEAVKVRTEVEEARLRLEALATDDDDIVFSDEEPC